MKKSKLSITLMAALLGVGALAGCDNNPVKPSPKGIIVSYTVNGQHGEITADEILVKYYQDSTKYESIFNAIKSVVIKNYFTVNEDVTVRGTGAPKKVGLADVDALKVKANGRVEEQKIAAETSAHANKTSYKKEMKKIFEANGVENENQLFEKFLDEEKETKFTENMEEFHMDEMRDGYTGNDTQLKEMWTGYLADMLPYHVSHILVKVEDSSETNYHNGTISQHDCEKLYNVVESLSAGKNFNMVAKDHSEDTGSAVDHGALGLMEYSTGYIDEFKLGIYAYEQLYGKNGTPTEATKKIAIPTDVDFIDEFVESSEIATVSEIPTIDKADFKELNEVSKQEKSVFKAGEVEHQETVGGGAFSYPRNIIYNKVLNKHSFAFITSSEEETDIKADSFPVGTAGFHTYEDGENASFVAAAKPILSVKGKNEYRPIIVVRGGTAGDSGYQGIHFIVVNRDPFEDATNAKDYYSVVRPEETLFNRSTETYVNYNVENDNNKYNERITNLEQKFKGYDSDKWDKFVVRKYMKQNNLTIADELLNYELNRWIDNTIEVAKHKEERSRVQKWRDYTKVLEKQNKDRENLMPEMARIGFDMSVNTILSTANTGFVRNQIIGFEKTSADEYDPNLVGTKKEAVRNAETDLYNATQSGEGREAAQEALKVAKEALLEEAAKSLECYASYIGLSKEEFKKFRDGVEAAREIKKVTNPVADPADLVLRLSDLYDMKGAIFNHEN